MKLSFRWYGADDPISLEYIRQIPGMRSIVSAVYDVAPGEVWPRESLARLKEDCEKNGLVFDVVESIPVHEDIKLGRGDLEQLLENYRENIRRCAEAGVKCVTVLDFEVWPETMVSNRNLLAHADKSSILAAMSESQSIDSSYQPFGDGRASSYIVDALLTQLGD